MAKRHWNRRGDLESLFLRLEELILANSGADEFDEVFKLLVAKIVDEQSGRESRFRSYRDERATFAAIAGLLAESERTWPGLMDGDIAPQLTPEHLQVCVEALANHTVSGGDFQVIDGFFEFLVARTAKGAKGQYFTPRHVIEFCVRMLAPSRSDTVLDPACGSGGFLLHTLGYVRGQESLNDENLKRYCGGQLWGFDISGRAVRVAKALMALAGDGGTNILRLNSLLRPDMGGMLPLAQASATDSALLTVEDVCRTRIRRHKGFDVIMTNPPFAGEVREPHVLEGYAVSRGRTRAERDVLFVERCIELLRPGGRLAIVLPHNKFAGSAFVSLRQWLMRRMRVLAVVGLGRNTFLPHTHQKASVLFAQRRHHGEHDAPNERIFFAISEKDGKDSRGQIVYRAAGSKKEMTWERVDHDFAEIVTAYQAFKSEQHIAAG